MADHSEIPRGSGLATMYIAGHEPVAPVVSSEVPRNPLTRWDVSLIPANGIFLTKKLKN